MFQIAACHLANAQARHLFPHIPNILYFIYCLLLQNISNISQMDDTALPSQLLVTWCHHPHHQAHPQHTIWATHLQSISCICPNMARKIIREKWKDLSGDKHRRKEKVMWWWQRATTSVPADLWHWPTPQA